MLPPSILALVRNAPTVAPIPHRAVLSVTGSQAGEFLNGLITSPIPTDPQAHFFTTFLHAQGRVLYDAFVYAQAGKGGAPGFLVEYDARPSEAPPLLAMLKRYVLRSKVKLRDVSEEYDVWAAWGSEKEKTWDVKRKWDLTRNDFMTPEWDENAAWPWGTTPGVIQDRRAPGMGHRLLVRKGNRPQEVSTHDVASAEDYQLHRTLRSVPEGVLDIRPMKAFPMESNLDIMGALNYSKGCFVGQELTARTYFTGILRKRILPVAVRQSGNRSLVDSPLPLLDIRTVPNQRWKDGDGVQKTMRRSHGKLLSSYKGLGFALLRLEDLVPIHMELATLEIEDGETKYEVEYLWPDWWPRQVRDLDPHDHF